MNLKAFLLTFLAISAQAQTNVWREEKFLQTQMSQKEISKKYIDIYTFNPDESHLINQRNSNFVQSISRKLMHNAVLDGFPIFDFKDRIALNIKMLISNKNEIEHVLYTLSKLSMEKGQELVYLSEIEEKQIQSFVSKTMADVKIPANINPQRPFRFSSYIFFGKNDYNNRDKIEFGLEEALACTKPDTVKEINFSRLRLTKFPEVIFRFKNLKEIDLSNNFIDEIPASLWKMKKLQKVFLSSNPIDYQDVSFKRNKKVRIMNLQNTGLTMIPKSIRKLKKLDTLFIGNNDLSSISNKDILALKKLKVLNLYNAQIVNVPTKIYCLKNLKEIDLYHNEIRFLPLTITKMKNLETLALSFNDLWNLPQNFQQLSSLRNLYLHHNKLNRTEQLPDVQMLDLGFNEFSSIPELVFTMKNITELNVEKNRIEVINPKISTIQSLKKFSFSNNPKSEEKAIKQQNLEILNNLNKNGVRTYDDLKN